MEFPFDVPLSTMERRHIEGDGGKTDSDSDDPFPALPTALAEAKSRKLSTVSEESQQIQFSKASSQAAIRRMLLSESERKQLDKRRGKRKLKSDDGTYLRCVV